MNHREWFDEDGACKLCQGEIPHGHALDCFIYTQERRIAELEAQSQWVPVSAILAKLSDNCGSSSTHVGKNYTIADLRKDLSALPPEPQEG